VTTNNFATNVGVHSFVQGLTKSVNREMKDAELNIVYSFTDIPKSP